jgi:hypothetical protein
VLEEYTFNSFTSRIHDQVLRLEVEQQAAAEELLRKVQSEEPCFWTEVICEILDQLRLEITYQYAINHIDPYEGRNIIVRA